MNVCWSAHDREDFKTAYLGHPDTPDEFQEMIDILSLLVSMFAFLPY